MPTGKAMSAQHLAHDEGLANAAGVLAIHPDAKLPSPLRTQLSRASLGQPRCPSESTRGPSCGLPCRNATCLPLAWAVSCGAGVGGAGGGD